MVVCKRGRHGPAFILLVLAMEPNHGLGILNKLNEIIPNNRMDTAGIYRALKNLESNECVLSKWHESDHGPKKKVYHLTDKGYKMLETLKVDIEEAIENLKSFLILYDDLQ